jgi:hypothetical protein
MHFAKQSVFLLLLTLCCFGTAFGQKANKMTKKIEAQAMEKVEKLNNQIIAGDASAALTAEQVEAAKEVYMGMMKQLRAANKEEGTKEEKDAKKKAIRKVANQSVSKELLTKEQRKAKKLGKDKE